MAVLKSNEQQKILITGNRGFIGTNLIKKLNSVFHLIPMDQSYNRKIDILELDQLDIVDNIDVIIHLASRTSILNSTIKPYETYLTNIKGTLNILDFARQKNINKIINFSTYVYGKPQYFPIDEKHPINPHSPYTKSKLIAEKLCEYYAQDYGLNVVTLRPFYIYGPSSNKNSLIPSIIKQIKQKGKVILSNKDTRRDFLFIDDLVNLINKILLDFPKDYNIYNVGFGKSYSLLEVLEIIKDILKIDIGIEYDNSFRPNDIVDMVADISLLEKLYSWKPTIDITTGLRSTIDDIVINSAE